MKARALRRGLVTGLIALVQTTRFTGGYDFIFINGYFDLCGFRILRLFYCFCIIVLLQYSASEKILSYPKNASEENKKYITWQVAHKDIDTQKSQGFKGPKYELSFKTQLPQYKKEFIPEKSYNHKEILQQSISSLL